MRAAIKLFQWAVKQYFTSSCFSSVSFKVADLESQQAELQAKLSSLETSTAGAAAAVPDPTVPMGEAVAAEATAAAAAESGSSGEAAAAAAAPAAEIPETETPVQPGTELTVMSKCIRIRCFGPGYISCLGPISPAGFTKGHNYQVFLMFFFTL